MTKQTKKDITKFIILVVVVLTIHGMIRHFHINHFRTIVPGELYTSGQPRGMDYTRLVYKYHIATIVNVRESAEHRETNWYNEEKTKVRDLGVQYIEIPIQKRGESNGFPTEADQVQFRKLMSDVNNQPILLHGSAGELRVGRLAAVWLVRNKGYSAEEAMKVMKKIKGGALSEEEIKYVEDLAKEHKQIKSVQRRPRGV